MNQKAAPPKKTSEPVGPHAQSRVRQLATPEDKWVDAMPYQPVEPGFQRATPLPETLQMRLARAFESDQGSESLQETVSNESSRKDDVQRASVDNETGIPQKLKSGVEALSGVSLDDVRVHYHSSRPAQLQAFAYTQGSDIYVGPGQERHLPHETWHVVQQKQGRVKPTAQMKGALPLNDDRALEQEADQMGAAALSSSVQSRAGGHEPPTVKQLQSAGVVQLAKKVTVLSQAEGPLEWVVVDVPADGSCLLHAFNLGFFTQDLTQKILSQYGAGQVTADQVEAEAEAAFTEAVCPNPHHQEMAMAAASWPFEPENQEVVQPDTNQAYGLMGADLRRRIAGLWAERLEGHDQGLFQTLQGDVQNMLFSFLTFHDLQNREIPESEGLSLSSVSNSQNASPVSNEPPELGDYDFAYMALYHPDKIKTKPVDHQSGKNQGAPSPAMFGITPDELETMYVPNGAAQDGPLANLIRAYIQHLAVPAMVGDYIPMNRITLPPPGQIPEELVRAYVEEFAGNMQLWASQSALTAATAIAGTQTSLHTFDSEDHHVTTLAPGNPVNLYENAGQSHFQVMIGPFPAGFLANDQAESVSSQDEQDVMEFDSPFLNSQEPSNNFSSMNSPASGFHGSEAYNGDSFLEEGSYFDYSDRNITEQEWRFMEDLIDGLGQDFVDPNEVIGLAYRAAAMLDVPDVFSRPSEEVVQIINTYQEIRDEEIGKAQSNSRPWNDPIVPLAGFVGEMVTKLGVKMEALNALLPHATAYLNFHDKHKSWSKEKAGPRVEALKAIAEIMNDLSGQLNEPELAVPASIAEHQVVPSNLSPKEVVGTSMRSLLTLDPGNMVGYEPEDSQTWDMFRETLRGYVRAHLLNKHMGGSGAPFNIGYLSSEDNLKMSRMGEEYVKREVVENNRKIFYRVDMEKGMPELAKSPALLPPEVADMLVNKVGMTVAGVEPFINESGEKDMLFTPVWLKETLGIQDSDVHESSHGQLSFSAQPPDKEYISKVQPHHRKVIAGSMGQATNLNLETAFDSGPVREIMIGAQNELLKVDSYKERNQILTQARSLLAKHLSGPALDAQVNKLSSVMRQTGSVGKAMDKKKQKEASRAQSGKRQAFVAEHGSLLTLEQQNQVLNSTETTFPRMRALLEAGASPSEAVTFGLLRKQEYEKALEGVKNKKSGKGMHRFFQ